MEYFLISFVAGILTVLAPCVFTLLPVILGGSLTGKTWKKPATIITSLAVSIFIFTIILKASTLLIDVDPDFWKYASGVILIAFGIFTFFPSIWSKIDTKLGLSSRSDKMLHEGSQKSSFVGDVFVGAALGPVFSSCSPTYAIIIATILPQDPVIGVINLIIYLIGLVLILAVISVAGQKAIKKAKWAVNPNGIFKKVLGVIFILVGLFIFTGLDKEFETYLLDNGIFDVTKIESALLEDRSEDNVNTTPNSAGVELSIKNPYKAPEITGIEDWINTDPLTLESLEGKVVLIDFWTYSCINCIRTLPYLTSWYDKYRDEGLVIIGMHAPEFAFEKVKGNVEKAVEEYDINYPVGLDNNFSTWNAFENRYWPAGYYIDREGNIVHTHFGEGDYEENEKIIQYLLGIDGVETENEKDSSYNREQTPETYLGYERANSLINANEFVEDKTVDYAAKESILNAWSLEGPWAITSEYSVSKGSNSKLVLTFNAREVYLVMGAEKPTTITIKVFDGDTEVSSEEIEISDYDLYTVAKLPKFTKNQRLEITAPAGVEMHAFTFGG